MTSPHLVRRRWVLLTLLGWTVGGGLCAAQNAKPKAASQRQIESYKKSLLKQFGKRTDGHLLLALEEATPQKAVGIAFKVCKGRDAAVEDVSAFMLNGNPTKRSFQVLAWFDENDEAAQRAEAHRAKLQGFIDVRLQKKVFSREACYSDLNPNSGQSINQGISAGTIIRYYPFR
jgi:hypothetical protein